MSSSDAPVASFIISSTLLGAMVSPPAFPEALLALSLAAMVCGVLTSDLREPALRGSNVSSLYLLRLGSF